MQSIWMAVRPSASGARLLAMASPGETILKARLLANPAHRRALPTLLEGLALWQGHKVRAALCADESPCSSAMDTYPDLFTDPDETLHYRLEWVPVVRSRSRRAGLGGDMGDFQDLRQLLIGEGFR